MFNLRSRRYIYFIIIFMFLDIVITNIDGKLFRKEPRVEEGKYINVEKRMIREEFRLHLFKG